MATVIRNVRDIETAEREVLEHVVGGELRENQQLIIDVVNAREDDSREVVEDLPDWCNVYEGLTDDEVDRIEKSIVRSQVSRSN